MYQYKQRISHEGPLANVLAWVIGLGFVVPIIASVGIFMSCVGCLLISFVAGS